MIKWLLVMGVVAAVYYFLIQKKPLKGQVKQKQKTDAKSDSIEAEETVACAKCGTYVEVAEAFISGGKYYCSKECMERS